jgi:hypothetical protein
MTERTAVERAIDRMAEVFGNPGKAALRLFLQSLPPDTKIAWGGEFKESPSTVAKRLMDELSRDPRRKPMDQWDINDVERAIDLETKPARGKVIRLKHITREMVQADGSTVYVFGDNMKRIGYGGQAAAMRGEPNTIGVPTKWYPSMLAGSYFTDADWLNDKVALAIHYAFRSMRAFLDAGRDVVIPADGLGTGLAELPRRAPRIHRAIEERIADESVHMIVTTDARTYIFTGKE